MNNEQNRRWGKNEYPASEVSGISYLMEADEEEVEKILG